MFTKTKKGVTLIEMIVVIAILALLATTIIPEVASYTKSAENTKDRAEARILLNAIEMYNASTVDENKKITNNTVVSSWFESNTTSLQNTQHQGFLDLYNKFKTRKSPIIDYTVSQLKSFVEEGIK